MCEDFASAVGYCVKVIFGHYVNSNRFVCNCCCNDSMFFGVILSILAKIMQEGDFSFYEASLFANLTTYG